MNSATYTTYRSAAPDAAAPANVEPAPEPAPAPVEETPKEEEKAKKEENPLKTRIRNLGLAVLEGRKIVGEELVGRAIDMIETEDYRAASAALKAGEELDETLRKKIKMTALLAALGSESARTPNFDLLPSFEQDRVMLLGSLAFLGLELLKEEDDQQTELPEAPGAKAPENAPKK